MTASSPETEAAPVLSVEGLAIAVRGVPAVDGLDLDVGRGETVALVGESGCGKSLTALAVMGLLPAAARIAAGRVTVGGEDLTAMGEADLQQRRGRRLAMIFQEPVSSLNPLMTVGDQVAEALVVHGRADPADARRSALDMLEQVGIPNAPARLDQYPFELSGGMCQRVMIAMALIGEPALLIADEPTTALDVTIQAQILDLMKRLRRETGTALLLITHDMGVVADMADRVAVMYAGRIVEEAAIDDLFERQYHPYTRLLLATIPRLEGDRKTALAVIEGSVPDIEHWAVGCRFHPRCPLATDRCRSEQPPLAPPRPGAGRRTACWHADRVEELGR